MLVSYNNMYLFILVGVTVGGVVGFVLGWRKGTQTNPGLVDFADSEEVQEFSEKGHAAINERIERRKARIMDKARAEGQITNDGVEELFCISDRTATVYLNALVDEGKLLRSGTGRGTMYTPI